MSSPNYSYSESNYNSDSDNNPQQSNTPLKVTLKLKLPKQPLVNNSQNEYSNSVSPNYDSAREHSYDYSGSSKHYSPVRNSYHVSSSKHNTSNKQSESYSYSEASELTEYDYSDDEKSQRSRANSPHHTPSPAQLPPTQPKLKIKLKLNQNQETSQKISIHQSPVKPKILLKLPSNPQKQIHTQPKKSLIVKLLLPRLLSPEPYSPSQNISQRLIADPSPDHENYSSSVPSVKNEAACHNSDEEIQSPIQDQTFIKTPSPKKESNVVIDLSNEPEDSSVVNGDDGGTQDGSDDQDNEDDEDEEDLEGEEEIKTENGQTQQQSSIEPKKISGRKGKKKRGRPPVPKAESNVVSEASKAPSVTPVNITPSRYLYPVIQRLISRLERKDDYALFLQPVDTTVVDDYLTVIKQPMDLSTMKKKIEDREYTHIDQFKEDLILLCDNAMTYNGPDTLYYKEAGKLKEFGVTSINKQSQYIIPYDPSQHPPAKDQGKSLESENQVRTDFKTQGSASKTRREESVDILDFPGAYPPSSTRSPSVSGMSQTTVAASSKRRKYHRPIVLPPKPPFNPDGSVEYVGQPETTFWDHFAYGLPPLVTHLLPPNANSIEHFVYSASHMDYGTYPQLIDSLQASDPLYLMNPAKLTELDPQDAILFGDRRGMAYMSSLEKFSEGLDPMVKDYIKNKLNYVTNGSYTKILNQRANSDINGQHM